MPRRVLTLFVLALVVRLAPLPAAEPVAKKPEASKFIRVTRDEKKQILTLDTSVVRYLPRSAGGAKLDPRVNEKSIDGRTPLHLAASNGHKEVVEMLLAKGALPDAKTTDGLTPLHLAAEGGHKEVAEMLLTAMKNRPQPAYTVDLIGAVHIGDKTYYEKLNKAFEAYDALLYELVAPQGTRIPKNASTSRNPLALLQSGMGNMLELDYQLTNVDYQKDNFVHADMSPEDFSKSMEDRGEGFMQMILKSMGQGIVQQGAKGGQNADAALMMALMSPNRATALKRALAQQFENLEGQMEIFGGPDGSTIITERNKVALKVLSEQIKAGKKKIGIFYGAGHMSDMEKRLLAEFGLERADEQWLTAWDMTPKAKPAGKDKATEKPPTGAKSTDKNPPSTSPKSETTPETSKATSDKLKSSVKP